MEKQNIYNFMQIKNQNFYVANTKNGGDILKSYSTICGYITAFGDLYRVKYSSTTAKQITKFAFSCYGKALKQHIVDAQTLRNIIFENEKRLFNTQYNGQVSNQVIF